MGAAPTNTAQPDISVITTESRLTTILTHLHVVRQHCAKLNTEDFAAGQLNLQLDSIEQLLDDINDILAKL